jgi:hypothetical protein
MRTDTQYLLALAKQVKRPTKQLPVLLGQPPKIQDNNQSIALGAINEDIESNLRSQVKSKRESQQRRTVWND